MGPILRLSQSGRYADALQAVQRLLEQNLSFDDFGWLRRQVLIMEASIHEDAKQHLLAVEKLAEIKKLGSPNASAFVQDEIALALGLDKLNRSEDALQELDGALQASSPTHGNLPSPLDIQAALVHYAKISRRLGRDVPGKYRGLFVQTAEKLHVPPDMLAEGPFLYSMILRAEEWLHRQSELAVSESRDPLFRPPGESE